MLCIINQKVVGSYPGSCWLVLVNDPFNPFWPPNFQTTTDYNNAMSSLWSFMSVPFRKRGHDVLDGTPWTEEATGGDVKNFSSTFRSSCDDPSRPARWWSWESDCNVPSPANHRSSWCMNVLLPAVGRSLHLQGQGGQGGQEEHNGSLSAPEARGVLVSTLDHMIEAATSGSRPKHFVLTHTESIYWFKSIDLFNFICVHKTSNYLHLRII